MGSAAIMFQGTGSDVGKSLLVAGLCRAFFRRGLRVRPFKPQNMSNNAAVARGGGEIGRAQALQALASGVPPHPDMNPVLLKPETDVGAQVVVQGRMRGRVLAGEFQSLKRELRPRVLESFSRLTADADVVVVEGAGSPAEVNLRAGDIANMGFARAAGVPVLLVGDIDRGGVIASIVGTMTLLPPADRACIEGFIINKFRGDPRLFDDGMKVIVNETGLRSLGVVPFIPAASRLPSEDAVVLEAAPGDRSGQVLIAVPRLSRIANFDDLDPLGAVPGVSVDFVEPGRALPGDARLIVVPGSKSTIGDLAFLRAQGWDIDILAHVRRRRPVLGLCAGLQMLGRTISDPDGIEGPAGKVEGLGLLRIDTVLGRDKTLAEVEGVELTTGEAVRGYEMHVGQTSGPDCARPLLRVPGRDGGARSADGLVAGCYMHGLFSADGFRAAFLSNLGARKAEKTHYEAGVDEALNVVADVLEQSLDVDRILEIANGRKAPA